MPGYGKKIVNKNKVNIKKKSNKKPVNKNKKPVKNTNKQKKVMKGAGSGCGYSKQKGGKHCGGHKNVMNGGGGCPTSYKVNQKGSGNCGGNNKVMSGAGNNLPYNKELLSTMTPEQLTPVIMKLTPEQLRPVIMKLTPEQLRPVIKILEEIARDLNEMIEIDEDEDENVAPETGSLQKLYNHIKILKTNLMEKVKQQKMKGGFIRDFSPMRNVSGKRTCRS